ncbi:hypothetical protein D187_006545 [Cystobacter fuscus DSM 2262]|uniref:Uncharacterized protein n=1 Tax=Cystobacter fuscus (strain ATCC 25194 / DSM 2262 / NBRC 100088 / M29) TaxID=1242864 RepID=S9PFI8_CYSF2|nr:hypothetical protein D187_006545 [Cystobacter fuscus DSM 2262]
MKSPRSSTLHGGVKDQPTPTAALGRAEAPRLVCARNDKGLSFPGRHERRTIGTRQVAVKCLSGWEGFPGTSTRHPPDL